jgi:hypothetical protein
MGVHTKLIWLGLFIIYLYYLYGKYLGCVFCDIVSEHLQMQMTVVSSQFLLNVGNSQISEPS